MHAPRRVAALVVCLTGLAAAQDIQAFKPAVGTWNYLSVNGAAVAEPGLLMPSLYVNYGRNPLVHRDADGNIPITHGMLVAVTPFSNSLVTIELTGAELLESLENALKDVDPASPAGGFMKRSRGPIV